MNKDNKKLGMGLGALLSKSESRLKKAMKINISQIYPNKNQPRKNFDEKSIKELAQSIKNQGLLQPIIVSNPVAIAYVAGAEFLGPRPALFLARLTRSFSISVKYGFK